MNLLQFSKDKLAKIWKASFCTAFFMIATLSFNSVFSNILFPPASSDDSLPFALELETNFWNAVVSQSTPQFSNDVAFIFQGINALGNYSRSDFITALKDSGLKGYEIVSATSLQFQDVLVLSYYFNGTDNYSFNGYSISVWKFEPDINPVNGLTDEDSCSNSNQKNKKHRKKRKNQKSLRGTWRMVSHSSGESSPA